MGRRRRTIETQKHEEAESYTLPPSPTHSFSSSSSSSGFEFGISMSPRKPSTDLLCPADELFYKGQLLPLHLSPRISMVRTPLLSAPRDSTASTTSSSSSFITNDCDSSRPSSATDDDNHFLNKNNNNAFTCYKKTTTTTTTTTTNTTTNNNNKHYFSFSGFSSVFRKPRSETDFSEPSSSVKRMGNTAREVIRKYFKKVKKPLYGKFSQKTVSSSETERSANGTGVSSGKKKQTKKELTEINTSTSAVVSSSSSSSTSYSFSGTLRYPRRRRSSHASSCPSSMISSPTHSAVLPRGGACYADASTMEELQNGIQGAIAHCKNSLLQN